MERGRRRRTVGRRLPVLLGMVKALALGSLLGLVVAGGALPGGSPGSAPESSDQAYQRVVERAVQEHDCAVRRTDRAEAASALVRTTDGDVRVVSFETGWEVFNGERPGTLIAVCLDARRPTAP